MPTTHKTPIERFIDSFVRQNTRLPKKIGVKYIEKAEALIDQKLGYCCDNPSGTLDLKTPKDNILTNSVRMFLKTMPLAGNTQSLERTKEKLRLFRLGICAYCED